MAAGAWGHASLSHASPVPGATLDKAPGKIELTFSEAVEPSVSEIRVLDSKGTAFEKGSPVATTASQRALEVPIGQLARGTYTVEWRVVSSDDGHGTSGTFVFGVGVVPPGSALTASTSTPTSSDLELAARWIFLIGLVALLGASVAGIAGFGGATGTDARLAAGGWLASAVGLVLLAEAQRRTASSSVGTFLDTPTGHAIIRRGIAIAIAGAALVPVWRVPRARRGALFVAALAAIATIAFHVGAGHAAAGPWPSALTISAQTAHFAAAGIWFGGLAALLLGIRGGPSAAKSQSVRRFAIFAGVALVVVVATGTLRAIDELSSVGQLVSTGYGRAVLAKIALVAIIAAIAARNRRGVAEAATELRPLRRRASLELALAAAALAVAALLGTLAPPAPAGPVVARGLSASGIDPSSSVQAQLTTAASRLGPNQFVVRLADADSGEPLALPSPRLRFTPVDDPHVRSSTLALRRVADETYVASGSNLKFDGRWEVDLLARRGSEAVTVPLRLNVPGPNHFVSVERIPGQPPTYTMQIGSIGYIRIAPDPERAGPSRVRVTVYTALQAVSKVESVVVTAAGAEGPTRRQTVRRLSKGRFLSPVELQASPETIAVVAHTRDGTRLRGEFRLRVPSN
jgi:copper transport protein